jgi:hypothetical protein
LFAVVGIEAQAAAQAYQQQSQERLLLEPIRKVRALHTYSGPENEIRKCTGSRISLPVSFKSAEYHLFMKW